MRLTRRGFTLIELIVGLLLVGVLSIAVHRILVSTQRNTHLIAQRIDVQQNVRSTAHYLSTVLRELNAGDGDIVSVGSDSMRVRGMRWTGVLCDAPTLNGGNVRLRIRRSKYFGSRAPSAALDSVLIYQENDPTQRLDDRWVPGGLVSSSNATCADGAPATRLTVSVPVAEGGPDTVVAAVTPGAPVRGFQIEELSLGVEADGRTWLSRRTANRSGSWTSREPILGPFQAASGIQLTFFDSLGAATGVPAQVASMAVTVRGESRDVARGSAGNIAYARDSLATWVALRNNPRY